MWTFRNKRYIIILTSNKSKGGDEFECWFEDKGIFEIDFMSSKNNIENRAHYWIEVDLHTRFMTGKIPFRLISIEQHERQG